MSKRVDWLLSHSTYGAGCIGLSVVYLYSLMYMNSGNTAGVCVSCQNWQFVLFPFGIITC